MADIPLGKLLPICYTETPSNHHFHLVRGGLALQQLKDSGWVKWDTVTEEKNKSLYSFSDNFFFISLYKSGGKSKKRAGKLMKY